MAIPVIENYAESTSTGTTITCAAPSGIENGELLVLFVATDLLSATNTISTPAGWTDEGQFGDASLNFPQFAIFTKVAAVPEDASVNVTVSGSSNNNVATYFRISGCNGIGQFGLDYLYSLGRYIVAYDFTTVEADSLVLLLGVCGGANYVWELYPYAPYNVGWATPVSHGLGSDVSTGWTTKEMVTPGDIIVGGALSLIQNTILSSTGDTTGVMFSLLPGVVVPDPPIEGSSGVTLADVTIDSDALVITSGDTAQTLDSATLAADAQAPCDGELAITLDGIATNILGDLGTTPLEAVVLVTLDAIGIAATGELGEISGSAALTLSSVTTDLIGDLLIDATTGKTLGSATVVAEGESEYEGSVGVTLAGVTANILGSGVDNTGRLTITGAGAGGFDLGFDSGFDAGGIGYGLDPVTVVSTGALDNVTATASITLDDATLSAASTIAAVEGDVTVTLGAATLSATGELNAGAGYEGSLTKTLDRCNLGSYNELLIKATTARTLDDATAVAAGNAIVPPSYRMFYYYHLQQAV